MSEPLVILNSAKISEKFQEAAEDVVRSRFDVAVAWRSEPNTDALVLSFPNIIAGGFADLSVEQEKMGVPGSAQAYVTQLGAFLLQAMGK